MDNKYVADDEQKEPDRDERLSAMNEEMESLHAISKKTYKARL